MSLQILSVGMLDVDTFGRDTFFVQISDNEVMLYEAHKDGTVKPVVPTPAPLVYVTASIEKFNNTYRVEKPIPIGDISELPNYLGKFEIISDTACRYVQRSGKNELDP